MNRMVEAGLQGVEFWAFNTDVQALAQSRASQKVQMGQQLTRGLGTGGNPELGERAAEESRESVEKAISDSDMVFITAGMGGGRARGPLP